MNFTQDQEILEIHNTIHVAVINIPNYKCVIWNHFPSHVY